jgi:hypothetical protein
VGLECDYYGCCRCDLSAGGTPSFRNAQVLEGRASDKDRRTTRSATVTSRVADADTDPRRGVATQRRQRGGKDNTQKEYSRKEVCALHG